MSPESERLRNLFLYCITTYAPISLLDSSPNRSVYRNDSDIQHWQSNNTDISKGTEVTKRPHDVNGDIANESPDELTGSILNITEQIVTPAICAFGVIGNVLTLVLFSKRILRNKCTSVEKSCLITLSSLCLSDLCFCLITCAGSLVRTQGLIFTSKDFGYIYQMYRVYFQNVFIKASTWLTMIAGMSRYAIVGYPIWARNAIRLIYVKITVFVAFIVAFMIHIPLIWTHSAYSLLCGNFTLIVLDSGYFLNSQLIHDVFTYVWVIFGYFLPVIVLAYCNVRLVVAYRKSKRFRLQHSRDGGGETNDTSTSVAHDRITVTLIILILFFIVLMSPSEILHFCQHMTSAAHQEIFTMAVVIIYFY